MRGTANACRTAAVGADGAESALPADATRRSQCDVLVVHTTG